jgi:hypothetical protein
VHQKRTCSAPTARIDNIRRVRPRRPRNERRVAVEADGGLWAAISVGVAAQHLANNEHLQGAGRQYAKGWCPRLDPKRCGPDAKFFVARVGLKVVEYKLCSDDVAPREDQTAECELAAQNTSARGARRVQELYFQAASKRALKTACASTGGIAFKARVSRSNRVGSHKSRPFRAATAQLICSALHRVAQGKASE